MTDPILKSKDTKNELDFDLNHLQPEEKSQMEHLLNSHVDIFSTSSGDLGLTSL